MWGAALVAISMSADAAPPELRRLVVVCDSRIPLALQTLADERSLLGRTIYKNTLVHRRQTYLTRLLAVFRGVDALLEGVDLTGLRRLAATVAAVWRAGAASKEAGSELATALRSTSAQASKLRGLTQAACVAMSPLVVQGFYVPFALGACAILGRVFTLAAEVNEAAAAAEGTLVGVGLISQEARPCDAIGVHQGATSVLVRVAKGGSGVDRGSAAAQSATPAPQLVCKALRGFTEARPAETTPGASVGEAHAIDDDDKRPGRARGVGDHMSRRHTCKDPEGEAKGEDMGEVLPQKAALAAAVSQTGRGLERHASPPVGGGAATVACVGPPAAPADEAVCAADAASECAAEEEDDVGEPLDRVGPAVNRVAPAAALRTAEAMAPAAAAPVPCQSSPSRPSLGSGAATAPAIATAANSAFQAAAAATVPPSMRRDSEGAAAAARRLLRHRLKLSRRRKHSSLRHAPCSWRRLRWTPALARALGRPLFRVRCQAARARRAAVAMVARRGANSGTSITGGSGKRRRVSSD